MPVDGQGVGDAVTAPRATWAGPDGAGRGPVPGLPVQVHPAHPLGVQPVTDAAQEAGELAEHQHPVPLGDDLAPPPSRSGPGPGSGVWLSLSSPGLPHARLTTILSLEPQPERRLVLSNPQYWLKEGAGSRRLT